MPRYIVTVTETIEYTREFVAKDEDGAILKAQEMFEKDPKKFDYQDTDVDYEAEEA